MLLFGDVMNAKVIAPVCRAKRFLDRRLQLQFSETIKSSAFQTYLLIYLRKYEENDRAHDHCAFEIKRLQMNYKIP